MNIAVIQRGGGPYSLALNERSNLTGYFHLLSLLHVSLSGLTLGLAPLSNDLTPSFIQKASLHLVTYATVQQVPE